MITVLYTENEEPIAAIELPPLAEEFIYKNGFIRINLTAQVTYCMDDAHYKYDAHHEYDYVEISSKRNRHSNRGEERQMLFILNDKHAELLRAASLLRKRRDLRRDHHADDFAQRFIAGLNRIG